MSQLILDPLTLSDGGDYTCTATYSLGGQTSPSGMDTHRLSIMSKWEIIVVMILRTCAIIIIFYVYT